MFALLYPGLVTRSSRDINHRLIFSSDQLRKSPVDGIGNGSATDDDEVTVAVIVGYLCSDYGGKK